MKRTKLFGIEGAMRNNNVVIVIFMAFIIIGAIALIKMPRNEFPTFTIRQGVIVGVYPGATSAEVEKQLTTEVENYIFGYKEVKKAKTYSYSREGIMYIFVELNDDVKNPDEFWSKLRHGLTELKMTLPRGVLALVANSDFGDTSALLITLSSDSKSYKELEEQLKKLENECRKIPATSKIKHFGLQKEKIFVNVKPELLNEYNIKTLSLLGSYQTNGGTSYAGKLDDGQIVLPIHFPPSYESEKDLAEQIVYSDPNGNVVRLKNIATIERRYDEPESFIRQNGKKSILLSLEMQSGNNIVQFGKDVDKVLENFKKQCPKEIEVTKISELPKYVGDSVNNFMKEFLIAIVAVILVTMILLPFRVASVAGITVPISVLITLSILFFLGVELHTVSLAALILVLGMIVDNAIVVIDNHVEKIDHGLSPWHAAIKSAKELITPIIVATLAIMASYIPLGFMVPGTAGEFMRTIPIVVSTALIVSIFVALFLVPYLNFVFIKKGLNKNNKRKRPSILDHIQNLFNKSLDRAFNYPKTVIAIGITSLVLAVLLFSNTDKQLFPEMERNQFAVEIYLPTGSSLQKTQKVIDSLETILLKDKRITNVTSFIGTSSPRFHTVYAPQMPTSNYGQLLVNTISDEATREIVKEYSPKYSNSFANAYVKWKILAMQASKAPIEIRISSDSIKGIRETEAQIKEILSKTEGIEWIRTDWDQPQQNIIVAMDKDKANRLSYYNGLVSSSLMIGLDGVPLTTIWEGDYPVDVILTQENSQNNNINLLKNQFITSPATFGSMPLRSFAQFYPQWTEGTIVRRNGIPTLTILVDNKPEMAAASILDKLKPQFAKLDINSNTSISYGGDDEAQQEVFVPMGIALGVSIILIFFILLIQFRKQKTALLIMSSMLLTLPGAAIGLKLMNFPFSITAFIGISSLCGMVVRNGIILIDYARELREKEKMSVREAAISAGKRRMRPIFLTSAAAGIGVVPMILSRSALWGPLGAVICFGLFVSMVLTLYILPILYSLSFSDKIKKTSRWSLPSISKKLTLILILLFPMFNFNSSAQTITLDSCKALALKNNFRIREANNQIEIAQQQRKEAFTNYFPKVSASAMALKASDYFIDLKTEAMNFPVWDGQNPAMLANPTSFAYVPEMKIGIVDYLNTASLSVAQPVFTGGRIIYGNKLAEIGEEVSICQKKLTINQILIHTEELFWNLQSLNEKEKTLVSYQKMLDSLYSEVNSFANAGLTHRNDLLIVQIKQNEIRSNLFKLRNGINLNKRALCQHIGISYDTLVTFNTSKKLDYSVFTSNDPNDMVQRRVEIELLNKSIEAKKLQKKMEFGKNLPQISLLGVALTDDVMEKTSNNALVMVNLSVPITDWWAQAYKSKKYQLEIENAQAMLDENTELIALQIRMAANELDENRLQIMVTQKSVDQAKENLKISQDNYKAGIIRISELLEAQAIYQQALDNLTDALCQHQIKLAKYLDSIGEY